MDGDGSSDVPTDDNGDPLPAIVGWVNSGSDRGTIDVLWSCCVTIVLCVWVSTYPNAPSFRDKWYHEIQDKFNLACTGLFGPDLLFALASGQLSNARKSVKMFKNSPELRGDSEWTMAHAFFSDMGGFHLTSPDYPQAFPINAEQLYYLVKHGHLEFPRLTSEDISHMNKTDLLSRVLVTWQVLWFTITEFDRIARREPITTLELLTLTFSCIMIATSACWYYKPSISRPLILQTKESRSVKYIRDCARGTTHPDLPIHYYRTPLDFISRRYFPFDKHWIFYARLTHICRVPFFNREIHHALWDRLPSDVWIAPEGLLVLLGLAIQIPFSIALLAAWNYHFPTEAEKWAWRVGAIIHGVCTIFGTLYYSFASLYAKSKKPTEGFQQEGQGNGTANTTNYELSPLAQPVPSLPPETPMQREATSSSQTTGRSLLFGKTPPAPSPRQSQATISPPPLRTLTAEDIERNDEQEGCDPQESKRSRRSPFTWMKASTNLSLEQDPQMALPHRLILLVSVPTILYIVCRLYFYAESFAGLRAQPRDVYDHQRDLVPFW